MAAREIAVRKDGVDGWWTGVTSMVLTWGLTLGRGMVTGAKYVCWVEGATVKRFVTDGPTGKEWSQEHKFGVSDLTVVETVKEESGDFFITETKYTKG